jgi:hypothetical protein
MELSGVGRLLISAKPYQDESFMGYVIRLSEKNWYERSSWILKMAGFNCMQIHQSCAFVFRPGGGITALSQLTGVDEGDLFQLTYPKASLSGSDSSYLFFGQPVIQYLIQPARPKVCTMCLLDSAYCRRVWDLSLVTACPLHRCMLINQCPKCRRRISWVRNQVSSCPCGFDWREAAVSPVEEDTLNLVRHIHSLCGLSANSRYPPGDGNSPASALDLGSLSSAVIFMAGQYQGLTRSTGKHLAEEWRISELHGSLSAAYSVFENWPHNYYRFLDWRRAQEGNIAPGDTRLKTGIRKEFGKFYTGLNRYLPSGRHDFMRDAFAGYLGAHWDGGHLSNLSRGGGANFDSTKGRYVSKVVARQMLGIDQKWLEHFISTGRLRAVVRNMGRKRLFLIEAESLAGLKADLEQLLGVEEVRAQLGVSDRVIIGLARNGCLRPKRGPTADGFTFWKFEQKAVTDLLEKIRGGVEKGRAQPKSDTFSFREAVYHCGTSSASFVKAVVDGVVRPCRETSMAGLHGFLFSKESVLLFKRTVRARKSDY